MQRASPDADQYMNGKRQVIHTYRQFYRASHQNEIFMEMYGTGHHMLKAVSHNHKTSTTYCLLYDESMLKLKEGVMELFCE